MTNFVRSRYHQNSPNTKKKTVYVTNSSNNINQKKRKISILVIALTFILMFYCLCNYLNGVIPNPILNSNRDDNTQCIDEGKRGKKTYRWIRSAGGKNHKISFLNSTKPLSPFTNGELPVCRLDSSIDSPLPVILMCLGRSGSSATWQVMSKLTGHCFRGREITGSTKQQNKEIFSSIKPGQNGNWILEYLCSQQNDFKDKGGIIGFKWKPFDGNFSDGAIDGLRMIAKHTDPPIKVVRMRRNCLDVILSLEKHKSIPPGKAAHCTPGDTECITLHKKIGAGMHLKTNNLLDLLEQLTKEEDNVDKKLEELKVPHVKVSYEDLYFSDDAEEWMKIFRFIGRGPGSKLSKGQVEEAMEHVGTSDRSHKVTISNYDEIVDLLKGTKFEALLH